jgi:hypothetical protein
MFLSSKHPFSLQQVVEFTPSKNKETFEFLLLFPHDVRITKMDICVA